MRPLSLVALLLPRIEIVSRSYLVAWANPCLRSPLPYHLSCSWIPVLDISGPAIR